MNLKPCPFCGNDIAPKLLNQNELDYDEVVNPYWTVCCRCNEDTLIPQNKWTNGCGAMSGYEPTIEKAIEAWNRRY